MTPEGAVKNEIKKLLKKMRKTFFWFVQDRFTAGIPDVIGCCRGLFFALEIKAPGERPNTLQTIVLRLLRAAGAKADWTDSVEKARTFLNEVEYESRKYMEQRTRRSRSE